MTGAQARILAKDASVHPPIAAVVNAIHECRFAMEVGLLERDQGVSAARRDNLQEITLSLCITG
jgi:hypothetical protein